MEAQRQGVIDPEPHSKQGTQLFTHSSTWQIILEYCGQAKSFKKGIPGGRAGLCKGLEES